MKSCPLCEQSFPDEYSFCLSDGTPLAAGETQFEEPTIVKERVPTKRSSRRSIILFVLAALLSLSLGTTVSVLYFFWPGQTAYNAEHATSVSPSKLEPTISKPTPSPRGTVSAGLAENSPRPDQPAPPTSPDTSDPGPTRISFRRGRVGEEISGSVSHSRSFVLSARPGQNLSADVESDDDCVNFATGDSTLRYITRSADNSLTVLNSCDRPARFKLTVSIR